MKVRPNGEYTFNPVLFDVADAGRIKAKKGDRVRVIQLPGAPTPNTMGQCHIELLDGTFAGMVMTNSLEK